MSRFTGRQHKGAQAATRAERRADAEKRNLATPIERRKQYRLNPDADAVESTEPTKRKRNRK